MITSKIFQQSQRHEWFEPDYYEFKHAGLNGASIAWLIRFFKRLDEIKPHQTVTRLPNTIDDYTIGAR